MSRPRDRLSPCEWSRTWPVRPQVASYRAGARLPGARDVLRGGRRHLATVSSLHLRPQSLSSANTGQRMGGAPSMLSTPSTSPFCGPRTRTTMGMIPFRIARLRPNHSSRGTPGNRRSRRPTSGTFASRRKASPELIVGCVSRTPAPRLLSAPESAGYLPANVCPVELLSLVPQNLRGTIARGKEAGGAPSRPAPLCGYPPQGYPSTVREVPLHVSRSVAPC